MSEINYKQILRSNDDNDSKFAVSIIQEHCNKKELREIMKYYFSEGPVGIPGNGLLELLFQKKLGEEYKFEKDKYNSKFQ